jgi:hypothetical protein
MSDSHDLQRLIIEVTGRERHDIVRALRELADGEEESDNPAEADRLRGTASRIERE